MTPEEAIKVLIQVAIVAQAKGALSLEDAVIVKQSIDLFKPAVPAVPAGESKVDQVEDAEVI